MDSFMLKKQLRVKDKSKQQHSEHTSKVGLQLKTPPRLTAMGAITLFFLSLSLPVLA